MVLGSVVLASVVLGLVVVLLVVGLVVLALVLDVLDAPVDDEASSLVWAAPVAELVDESSDGHAVAASVATLRAKDLTLGMSPSLAETCWLLSCLRGGDARYGGSCPTMPAFAAQ